jgi:hypothetical protein
MPEARHRELACLWGFRLKISPQMWLIRGRHDHPLS